MVLKKNKKMKTVMALFLSLCMLIGIGVSAEAASGYRSKAMKGSSSYTKYSCSLYGKANFWDVEVHADGTSRTLWNYNMRTEATIQFGSNFYTFGT